MAWQQYVVDVALEIDVRTGRLFYSEVDLTVPRQSGKSTLILAKSVHRSSATKFFGPRQQIVYTAQTRKDSRKKWEEDYVETLKASKTFRDKIVVHLGNGNEHLRFPNRSRFGIESTTEKSGHGATLDEGFVDEAFAQVDGRVEQGFRPAMITRTNTQLWVVSTAGWQDGSPYLWAKVERGREITESGQPSRVAYFEWSAPEGTDPYERELWPSFMPALGEIRPDGTGITAEAIEAELEAALGTPEGLNGFMRPYMNLWVPRSAPASTVIPLDIWADLADLSENPAGHVGKIVLGVDSDPDQAFTSICAAGYGADSLPMVEIIHNLPGIEWAFGRICEIHARNPISTVVIDKRSTAASLIEPLTKARVPVYVVQAGEMAQACGEFYTAATETRRLRHLGQLEMLEALKAAMKRPLGDAWAWDKRRPISDITPITSPTLAHWALVNGKGTKRNAGAGRVIALN